MRRTSDLGTKAKATTQCLQLWKLYRRGKFGEPFEYLESKNLYGLERGYVSDVMKIWSRSCVRKQIVTHFSASLGGPRRGQYRGRGRHKATRSLVIYL